ncbi:hypothetical protein M436DRAFT_81278 [Aureobasidium namibiae CBS 147.97]|uniref:Uncharacterized protein n=1 Tax=Aureobasidium namibiae CBS 147.97 TaxID=1043004 RepID=A0A074WQH7_9PEZI
MPPRLYICCHFEISNEHNGPPSRPRAASRTTQDVRRTSRRHSPNRERPRERSRADRLRHHSHHRSESASRTNNDHPPTTPRSTTQAPPNHALTTQNLYKSTHKSEQHRQAKSAHQKPVTSPRQAKQNYIAKWLQGLRSMSALSSSATKTKSGSDEESSSVEVVAARDAKGRGKGIRVVSDEVEEGTGVGGEEGEV